MTSWIKYGGSHLILLAVAFAPMVAACETPSFSRSSKMARSSQSTTASEEAGIWTTWLARELRKPYGTPT